MIAAKNREVPMGDMEKPFDMEVALHILRLMDGYSQFTGFQDVSKRKAFFIGMAENAVKKMTNPYAKKMLMDEIIEH